MREPPSCSLSPRLTSYDLNQAFFVWSYCPLLVKTISDFDLYIYLHTNQKIYTEFFLNGTMDKRLRKNIYKLFCLLTLASLMEI